ncbi:DinB family protein [Bacillus tianshenii]|nr:DinB family protein [Bacillus tianshenii]
MALSGFSFARGAVLQVLNAAKEEQVDQVPEGFNNSIRWNAGHVIVIAESVLSHSEAYNKVMPEQFREYFGMGTSPADWKYDPPTVEEIEEVSTKQLQSIQELLKEQTELTKPFEIRGTSFTKLNDVLAFLSFHEGMHFTTMKTYLGLTK